MSSIGRKAANGSRGAIFSRNAAWAWERWRWRRCLRENDVFGAGPSAPANPLAPRAPQFAPRAKRVIYLFQAGGPSQLDMFNHRPALKQYDGQPLPAEIVKDQRYAFIKPDAALFASQFKFAKHGKCGAELSEVLPHLAEVVDDIAIVNSMTTPAFNHAPGQIFMNTGATQFGRPSMGAWVTYGLGSESRELPGFVVLSSAGGTSGGAGNWGAGFLPTVYQGVPFRRSGDPVLYLTNPPGITPANATAVAGRDQTAEPAAAGGGGATRKSPRASTRLRWRIACKRARRN